MIKLKEYHPKSMEYEDEFTEELLYVFGILLDELIAIPNLTESAINATIALWRVKYRPELEALNEDQLKRLNKLANKILPGDLSKKVQNKRIEKYTDANKDMLSITTDFIKNRFTELSVLENTYNYPTDLASKQIESTVRDTHEKLALFAVMSSINGVRELIFDNAQSLGYTEYQWGTMLDNKVRSLHREMQGKWVRFDDPSPEPAGFHVGMDYNCRCRILSVR